MFYRQEGRDAGPVVIGIGGTCGVSVVWEQKLEATGAGGEKMDM